MGLWPCGSLAVTGTRTCHALVRTAAAHSVADAVPKFCKPSCATIAHERRCRTAKKIWARRDLNPEPSALEADALPLRHKPGRLLLPHSSFRLYIYLSPACIAAVNTLPAAQPHLPRSVRFQAAFMVAVDVRCARRMRSGRQLVAAHRRSAQTPMPAQAWKVGPKDGYFVLQVMFPGQALWHKNHHSYPRNQSAFNQSETDKYSRRPIPSNQGVDVVLSWSPTLVGPCGSGACPSKRATAEKAAHIF